MAIKDVIGDDEDKDTESEHDADEYDAHARHIGELLGLDEKKAEELAEAICGLVASESEHEEEHPQMGHGRKHPGIAIVLGR